MDYRDERDALRGRVESLEDQLAATKHELAAAKGEPAPPSSPKAPSVRSALRGLGWYGGLFAAFWPFVFTPFMMTALGPLIVPPIARLAAPIVCPEGYVRSTVKTWSTMHGEDESSEHWELQCLDVAGIAHPAADVPTWATLFALTEGVVITSLGLFFGVAVLRGALRRARPA